MLTMSERKDDKVVNCYTCPHCYCTAKAFDCYLKTCPACGGGFQRAEVEEYCTLDLGPDPEEPLRCPACCKVKHYRCIACLECGRCCKCERSFIIGR